MYGSTEAVLIFSGQLMIKQQSPHKYAVACEQYIGPRSSLFPKQDYNYVQKCDIYCFVFFHRILFID